MLAILDYKAGNQTSVLRSLQSMDIPAVITAEPEVLASAHGVIFPGVGAAGQAMGQLKTTGQDMLLRLLVEQGKPLFGVCLGCQILLDNSEESDTATLGILPGACRRFQPQWQDGGQPIRIPHMGWNSLDICPELRGGDASVSGTDMAANAALLEGIEPDDQFYFVHSYYPEPAPALVLATTTYGVSFASIFGRPGLWAAQFHPEKSGRPGLRLLANFYRYCRESAHA